MASAAPGAPTGSKTNSEMLSPFLLLFVSGAIWIALCMQMETRMTTTKKREREKGEKREGSLPLLAVRTEQKLFCCCRT